MNNNDELFNGIIDVPNNQSSNSNIDINSNNLEYNFNFETEPDLKATANSQYQNSQNTLNSNVMNNQNYQVPLESNTMNNQSYQVPLNSNVMNNQNINQSFNINPQEQILSTNGVGNELESLTKPDEQKKVDYELLKNLNDDTNNFVNPDLIVNPSVKSLQEQKQNLNIVEPKVNYKDINSKRNYVFMAILFTIIIIFIVFLPKIVTLIGL